MDMTHEECPAEQFCERNSSSLESNTFYQDGHIRLDFVTIVDPGETRWWMTCWSVYTGTNVLGTSRVRFDMNPNQFTVLRAALEAIRDMYRIEFHFERE